MATDPHNPIPNIQHSKSKPKRPILVTALILLVLSYTSLAWFGFLEAQRHWQFMQGLPLAVPPLYLALRNLFWGLAGIPLVWGLWVGWSWVWGATQIAAFSYASFYWLDRLFLAEPSAIAGRWPFALSLTIICLTYTFVVLQLPRSRRFFKKD